MRLYKFICTKYALQAICNRELKVTELDKTNDVYELLPYRWDSNDEEETATYFKHRFAKSITMLCFSKNFSHPLLWGLYADNGEGICLGFDISDNGIYEVKYELHRIESGYRIPDIGILNEISDVLPRGLVKSSHWEYEKEWRLWKNKEDLKLEPCTGLYFFCFDETLKLAEVLIGPHHKEVDIERRIEKLMDNDEYRDPKPEIFCTRLSPFIFEIEKKS